MNTKPESKKNDYEALVLALVLAVKGNDEEKVNDGVVIAEGIAANLSPDDVARAKSEALEICDDIDDLNPILVVAAFENSLNNIHPAYFPWHRGARE